MADPVDIPLLDIEAFETAWAGSGEDEQLAILRSVSHHTPGRSIVAVLAGMSSYHFSVRDLAKQILIALKTEMEKRDNGFRQRPDASLESRFEWVRESSMFAKQLFEVLQTDLPAQELRLYLEVLLESGGRGPFFAWRLFQSGSVALSTLMMICTNLSEDARLALTGEYLKSDPAVRRRFGKEFRTLLSGIKSRPPVIRFFAWMFDNRREADPFLNCISRELRQPEDVLRTELLSEDPEIRAEGLKAAAFMSSTRFPVGRLKEMLDKETDPDVRGAIFDVVGHSPMGTYPEIADRLLDCVCTASPKEAVKAFEALVRSHSYPLYRMIDAIRERSPEVMTLILERLSTVSLLSHVFVHELVLNRQFYLDTNKDLYKALVHGMVKKRPERILEVFSLHDDHSDDQLRMAMIDLSSRIRQLLVDEKKKRTQVFARQVKQLKTPVPKKKGLLHSVLGISFEKKIRNLQACRTEDPVDFTGEVIADLELSSIQAPMAGIFRKTVIRDCDLTDSNFSQSVFTGVVFYKVDLSGSVFDNVNFDRAMFIDVEARRCRFRKCRFQNASFFRCEFDDSDMEDADFIGAQLVRTSFFHTRLSGASFACTSISEILFTDSLIDQTDFSCAQAVFSRFPSHTLARLEADAIDFNARSYQVSSTELPDLLFTSKTSAETILVDIDVLILGDFVHAGKDIFLAKNRFSLLTAFDVFKQKQADIFEIVPYLIHESVNFPGYDNAAGKAPYGISGYLPSLETVRLASVYLGSDKVERRMHEASSIEGLFTIGSTGTIAQAQDSDIDYWVCINADQFDIFEREAFDQKLQRIEAWALSAFKTEIHLFVVDIPRALEDDFGTSSLESSGSAQGRILKEEFYRTMIHVAGKLPLWCTLPVSVSSLYYDHVFSTICSYPPACRYINLGDIQEIPTEEYFGASIWQMFKSLKSPFKSVMKMALLEKFIRESGQKYLLCNRFKDDWMNVGFQFQLGKTDSYYTLLSSLIHYYRETRDNDSAKLVQICFFLKTGIASQTELDTNLFGLKKRFIKQCMKEWSWNKAMVFEMGNFNDWSYDQVIRLSTTIERYMIKTYKTVNHALDSDSSRKTLISPSDRTVLGRKMFVQFSNQPDKVGKTLLVSRSARLFQGLTIHYLDPSRGQGVWRLVHKIKRAGQVVDDPIISAQTLEEIGAWLVHNELYSEDMVINLVPNPTPVTIDDIKNLYNAMFTFFKHSSRVRFEALLAKATVRSLFVSINSEVQRTVKKVMTCTIVYENSWGEMFSRKISRQPGFSSMDQVLSALAAELGVRELPKKIAYHLPRSFHWGSSQ